MASGTVHPHHDSELISWYHDAFLPWDHYLHNIVLFYHDSPITRSHFMDPTDRAMKGFYCNRQHASPHHEVATDVKHMPIRPIIIITHVTTLLMSWRYCGMALCHGYWVNEFINKSIPPCVLQNQAYGCGRDPLSKSRWKPGGGTEHSGIRGGGKICENRFGLSHGSAAVLLPGFAISW